MSKFIWQSHQLTRRQFVLGGACLSAAGTMMGSTFAWAKAKFDQTQTLSGNAFNLTIGYKPVNFTGTDRIATTIEQTIPGPVLRWKEGETVTLNVTNRLAETTSIHWHGIILPFEMDGVPGLSFKGIPPGETFQYRFTLNQAGTYWYHSHSDFQEQTGMYGAIIVEPKEELYPVDKDYVIQLSDWTDENPHDVYAKLKKMSHYYNTRERTTNDLWRDIKEKGVSKTWQDRKMWNDMRMSDRDISDVTGMTYTFLMNGQTPDRGWTGLFKKGEKIRLRFINSAAMTFFDVRIPGLKMKVIEADGQLIDPVTVDEFRIGVAETYDVIVEPESDMAYSVFAQAIDRSGYARGTLTTDVKYVAEPPAMDAAPILIDKDMGMDMSGMDHGSMEMDHNVACESADEGHSQHGGMDHSAHQSMDHSQQGGMDHSGHQMSEPSGMGSGKAGFGSNRPIKHVATECGPHVDMRAMMPQYRLHEPGIGLENNGRKVLTYRDLCNYFPTQDKREPGREIDLHLTGNMARYMWSFNGVKAADAEPIILQYGERVRINLINDTMMNHPIHLHGMWSELETGDADYIPRKHTLIVPPGGKVSYLVTADAYGRWAYHCHLIYHMMGMFREVRVV